MDTKSKIILISGPTASGKSNFAVKVAKKIDGEIINSDSMQIYKQLKILTSRPNKKEQKNIKHHFYGFIDVKNNFSTGQWLKLTVKKIKEIRRKKKIPILVGGTGLYFQSLINGLATIPNIPNDIQRTIRDFEIKVHTKVSMYDWILKTKSNFKNNEFLKLYINFDRESLVKRIFQRTSKMIKIGAIQEVKKFNKIKLKKKRSVNKVIGIDELTKYLNNEIKLNETKELISIRTRQYAKRQATWARSKMVSWNKIGPEEILNWIKKINKSSLKLDQLI